MAVFFLIDWLFPWAARLMGAKGVTGLADPAGYPVATVLFSVIAVFATPLTNTFSRWGESGADRFSLENFNEPDGMAKALVKTVEYRAATPSKAEEFIFYNHPSVGTRIRRAMDWKATHPKAEPPSAPPVVEQPRPPANPPPGALRSADSSRVRHGSKADIASPTELGRSGDGQDSGPKRARR
jgi:hypothetical protein